MTNVFMRTTAGATTTIGHNATAVPVSILKVKWSDYDMAGKIFFALQWFALITGTVLSMIVILQIWLAQKLKFQSERLVFIMFCVQTLMGICFAILLSGEFKSQGDVVGVNCGTFHAFLYAVICLEVINVITANYALFLGRREISVFFESFGYFITVVVSLAALVISEIRRFSIMGNTKEHEMIADNEFMYHIDLAWVVLSLAVWVAHAIFQFRLLEQRELWRRIAEEYENLGEAMPKRTEHLIAIHSKAIKKTAVPLGRYFIAFFVCSLGMITMIIWRHQNLSMSNMDRQLMWMYPLAWFLINLQRLIQAIVYIVHNREEFTAGQFSERMRKRIKSTSNYTNDGRKKKFQFDRKVNVKLIAKSDAEYFSDDDE